MSHCDHEKCPYEPVYRCHCRRCDREDESGAFHACSLHMNSGQILQKHQHIYPSHVLAFFPFPRPAVPPKADLSEKVALSEIVAWLEARTEPGELGLHFQNTCKFLVRELRTDTWRDVAKKR